MLIKQNAGNKYISAICAAPAVALTPLGILTGKNATCYPAPKFREKLELAFTSENAVVVDQNVVTSQGPGTSLKFSLKLVELLYGVELKEKLAKEMCADV
jgi:4-methyl-5(b-hydroxyethyl)-thiazole monophosphate biosynthesis